MKIATPDTWYETTSLGDGVTHIHEPFIKAFFRCNIWHVRGRDRDMLVDSGMGVVSLVEEVSLVAERPCLAVASHTHFDHIGNHHEFAERLCHPDEAALMARPSRSETLADPYVADTIFTRRPPAPYSSPDYEVTPAPATRLIGEGDRTFEVIHTPATPLEASCCGRPPQVSCSRETRSMTDHSSTMHFIRTSTPTSPP